MASIRFGRKQYCLKESQNACNVEKDQQLIRTDVRTLWYPKKISGVGKHDF